MRLFTAIELPEPVRTHLARLRLHIDEFIVVKHGIDSPVSHTVPENLHVTLKFLGEVEEPAVTGLTGALRNVTWEAPARVWGGHAALLPPRGPVRVISVGLDGDVGRVGKLQSAIEAACADLGFNAERRAYLPHVTLGRARRPIPPAAREGLADLLNGHLPTAPFGVAGFTLFESRLGGGPPRYVPLARFGAESD